MAAYLSSDQTGTSSTALKTSHILSPTDTMSCGWGEWEAACLLCQPSGPTQLPLADW